MGWLRDFFYSPPGQNLSGPSPHDPPIRPPVKEGFREVRPPMKNGVPQSTPGPRRPQPRQANPEPMIPAPRRDDTWKLKLRLLRQKLKERRDFYADHENEPMLASGLMMAMNYVDEMLGETEEELLR